MRRADFEHVTRAVATLTDTTHVLWVGSQSLLGSIPEPPEDLTRSQEGDVIAMDAPERTDLVDGAIGELSPFHQTFGYYAHGVSLRTATLARGWRERLVRVCNENTRGAIALCIDPRDLAVSKLAAGRPKDVEFLRGMAASGIVDTRAVVDLAADLDPDTLKEGDVEAIAASLTALGWAGTLPAARGGAASERSPSTTRSVANSSKEVSG